MMDLGAQIRSPAVSKEVADGRESWTGNNVEAQLIGRARSGDEDAFASLVNPHRGALQLHCYRLLGSAHDAEDAVQETLLAAWRAFPSFESRSSIRTWLYRIATNRCLNWLRAQARRPGRADDMSGLELPEPSRLGDVLWLEPYPDRLLEGLTDPAPGPDAIYETKEAVSLAFITALQLIPARQRAVLILRDVLGYHAKEVAGILDTTEESVTSALKRARAAFADRPARAVPPVPRSETERAVVGRFVEAFEARDLVAVVDLLTEGVWFTMPPLPLEYEGRDKARAFLEAVTPGPLVGRRLLPTRANGQPALGMFFEDARGQVLRLVGLLVLTLEGDQISAITGFDQSVLDRFDLPRTLAL
jgi:RNA polymerase sigma-70 factor (ECF subfamily)